MDEKRRFELSNKFVQMGQSLISEGTTADDYAITQSGTILIILASIILSDEDMLIFSEICAMFSAKKIFMSMNNMTENELIQKILKQRHEAIKPKKPRGRKPKE